MEYNAEQRALKDSQKQKEFELDKELHKMYIDKLERQEREREVGLKKLYDRQSKQVHHYHHHFTLFVSPFSHFNYIISGCNGLKNGCRSCGACTRR